MTTIKAKPSTIFFIVVRNLLILCALILLVIYKERTCFRIIFFSLLSIYISWIIIRTLLFARKEILVHNDKSIEVDGIHYALNDHYYLYSEISFGLWKILKYDESYLLQIYRKNSDKPIKKVNCAGYSVEDRNLLNRISNYSQKEEND